MDVVNAANNSGVLEFDDSESYSKAWNEESLYVYISENGVEYLQWNTPLEIVECVNPCVELMPFEKIQKKEKNLLTLGLSWLDRK